MENEFLSLQLIKNKYDVSEGKTIISQLLADKINFLKKQIFKLEERYGIDSPFLENRVAELQQCQDDLDTFLRSVDEEDTEVLINCSIDIQLVPRRTTDKVSQNSRAQSWT